ncbi:hypothetical protein ACFV19_27900 [Streptomyces griseoluteus]|uniref:hypothetical protein n=1 Tax=Streptomyces griseoluteus TaxID=29306 RepID=UPI0036D13C95
MTVLAQSVGTIVVTLMTTDAWQRTREGLTQFWRRMQPERAETVAAEWEAGHEDVLAALAANDQETLNELRARCGASSPPRFRRGHGRQAR